MAKGTRTESGTWGGGHWPEEASLSLGITQIQPLLSTQAPARQLPGGVRWEWLWALSAAQPEREARGEASCVREGMGLSDGGGKKEGRL